MKAVSEAVPRGKGRWRWGGALLVLVLLLAFLALRPDCHPEPRDPEVAPVLTGMGPLRVGAAHVPFVLPERVSRVGYPAPHALADANGAPTAARPSAEALVLEAGDVRLALLSLDLLLIPEALRDAIRARAPEGVELVVVATHTHSGPGGFDERLLAGLAGTGWPQEGIQEAVVEAGAQALEVALQTLSPATMRWAQRPDAHGLNRTRTDGVPASETFSVLELETAEATHALVLLAAHPTLMGREGPTVDADYPSRVALGDGRGVTLVLQSAGGNAAAPPGNPDAEPRTEAFAASVTRTAQELLKTLDAQPANAPSEVHPTSAAEGGFEPSRVASRAPPPLRLERRQVRFSTLAPDAGRLVPWIVRGATERLLCSLAPAAATLTLWSVGPLRLLFIPAEVTAPLEPALLEAAGADALVTLADGYLGYAEATELVRQGRGEAPRQLFGPELAEVLVEAASTLR